MGCSTSSFLLSFIYAASGKVMICYLSVNKVEGGETCIQAFTAYFKTESRNEEATTIAFSLPT